LFILLLSTEHCIMLCESTSRSNGERLSHNRDAETEKERSPNLVVFAQWWCWEIRNDHRWSTV